MKKLIPALVTLGLASLVLVACNDSKPFLSIAGVRPPEKDSCSFKVDKTGFLVGQTIQVNMQKQLYGELGKIVGLQFHSEVSTPETKNWDGKDLNVAQRDVINLDSADISIVDEKGATVATETVVVQGAVPGPGDLVTPIEVVGKPFADALAKRNAAFTAMLNITVHGKTASGASVSTDAFAYPLDIRYDDLPTTLDPDAGYPDGASICP